MPLIFPVDDRESALLADYAMHSARSEGRAHRERDHAYRSCYQRDCDRITHCSAFRRLSHKTQVFTGEMFLGSARGDYHRTRLTHTLEVVSIARTLARALRLNEDLVEALALLHDIGHPPFGHAGEAVLDGRLEGHGGFNHNRQALRIVERLEIRYPSFPGLNLTHEVLAGQEYRGRVNHPDVQPPEQPLLEVQVVDASDSIAYDAHDADDALELGLLTIDQLLEVPMWREAAERVTSRFANLVGAELRRAVIHELIDTEVSSLIDVAKSRINAQGIATIEDVQNAPPLLAATEELQEKKQTLEDFLFSCVYRHPDVLALRKTTTEELGTLFDHHMEHPDQMPTFFEQVAQEEGLPRAVADYLSSFTDRSAREAFKKRMGG